MPVLPPHETRTSVTRSPEYVRLERELLDSDRALTLLATKLVQEQAISARFLRERDEGISAIRLELTCLTAELATERAIVARLFQERQQMLDGSRQHLVLSSHIGDYTSAFLDAKSATERAALLGAIRATTKTVWDSGVIISYEGMVKIIRAMMVPHGFVFREPGEGETGWEGYSTIVPQVDELEQLDRLVRTRRVHFGAHQWYLLELTTVLHRIGGYLEANP